MPQFAFRATDRLGNFVEGTIVADDQMRAMDDVRAMGYAPTVVQAAPSQVGAAPVAMTTAAHVTAQMASAAAAPFGGRPAPVDLTQSYVEQAPVDDTTAEMAARMARLEPWERSAAASIAFEEAAKAANPTPEPENGDSITQAIPPSAIPLGAAGRPAANGTARPASAGAARDRYIPVNRGSQPLAKRIREVLIYPIFSGVVLKELAPFYRQFATLIGAGLPIFQSLIALEANSKNAKLKEIARAGQHKVQNGGQFSDVMAERPWIFQPMQIALVRAAEQGGMLDDVFRQIADYVEHEISIRRLISHETLYPKIVLFVALMIIGKGGVAGGMAVVQLILGRNDYGISNYFSDTIGFGLTLLVPIFLCMAIFRLFLVNVPGVRDAYDTVKLRIPVIGGLVRTFAVARFSRTYSALSRAGFPVASSLLISGEASGNAVIMRSARHAAIRAEQGGSVAQALRSTNQFPTMAMDMLNTGESSGTLDTMMEKVADYLEAEGRARAHTSAVIFSVVVFLIVAIMVGSEIISFWQGHATDIGHAGSD